jgi:hypothetical protein
MLRYVELLTTGKEQMVDERPIGPTRSMPQHIFFLSSLCEK